MKKDSLFYIVVALFLGAFIWSGIAFYHSYTTQKLQFQGEVVAQSYNVSSKVPGRIAHVYVKKGDVVKVGDKIFSIYSPEIEAKLKQAKAAMMAAQAKKKQAFKGARKEKIQAAIEQYKKAKAAEELMEKTYKRILKLYEEGVISQQKKDEVYTKYVAAKHTANAAYEMMQMAKKGAREELKEAAKAQEEVYAAKVDEVESYLDDTTQIAFHAGEVSGVLIHEGELAPTGFPVVTLIDLDDVWVRMSIREDFLHLFPKGKEVELFIPALEKSYKFVVSYISPMGAFATWKATQSAKGYDMKSFEIELRPKEKIPHLRDGMSALFEVE